MTQLLERWHEMLDRQLPPGLSRSRLATTPPTDAFAAVRMPQRNAALLIGTDQQSARNFRPFEAESLSARIEWVSADACVVALELSGTENLDLFATLATDLLDRIDGRPSSQATSLIATRLERWHDLLNRRRRGLSLYEQRGLVGELEVLRTMLAVHDADRKSVVRSWRGPFDGLHDFLLAGAAAEVKSHGKGGSLRINGVAQLWPPQDRSRLLLVTVEVESGDDGAPLADHVTRTRALLAGEAEEVRELLEGHLSAGGWRDEDGERYPTLWTSGDPQVYEVVTGFPRLDPTTIPSGVVVSRYALAQTSAADFKTGPDELTSLVDTHPSASRENYE